MRHKKFKNKKMLSFLTIICCLVGSILPAFKTNAGEIVEIPRVTFTNEPKIAPDLYIKKELENAENYTGETPEFTFHLRLNGEVPNRMEYTVLDANGNEKTDGAGNKETYYTEGGSFTLKPEETAWFKNIQVGTRYEVTEDPAPFFKQVEPEGETGVTGIMTARGEQRVFRNRYIPNGPGKTTTLTVRKSISFPDGYTAPETPDFTFRVTLGGKAYAQETYNVIDNQTGKTVDSGITDEQGEFRLKGGYTAVFAEVPAGVDYKVEEIELPEGWRVTGDMIQEGATQAPETPLFFNNANASFVVTKQMESGSESDEDFKFLLTREDQTVWADAKYDLYDMATGQIAEEDKKTEADGTFTLKADQAAVFKGVEPGTVYNVSEIGNPGYIQTLPTSQEGYTGCEVTDSIEKLPFINKAVENKGVLTVTKQVESPKGDMPSPEDLAQVEFQFELYRITTNENGEKQEDLLKNQGYSVSVGSSTMTYATDKDTGIFTLRANETARFEALPLGEYKIKEVNLPDGYKIKPDTTAADDDKDSDSGQTGVLTRETNLAFTFTNEYTADKLDLQLTKKNKKEEVLANVPFRLWKVKGDVAEDTDWNTVDKSEVETLETDENGTLMFQNLESGIYYLQEIKAPVGYQPLEKPLMIRISRDKDDKSKVTVTVDGVEVTTGNESITDKTDVIGGLTLVQVDNERDNVQLTVLNSVLYELPNSGGSGIYLYILSGIILMMAASYVYWKKCQEAAA